MKKRFMVRALTLTKDIVLSMVRLLHWYQREQMPNCGYCQDCKWWARLTRGNVAWGNCSRFLEPGSLFNVDSFGGIETNETLGCVQFEALNA